MKLSLLVGGAIGYVLGTRAGHERYETIVSYGRKFAGSQTVQSTAGVLQAQFDSARQSVVAKLHGVNRNGVDRDGVDSAVTSGTNGFHH